MVRHGGKKVRYNSCFLSNDLAEDVFEGNALELHVNELGVASHGLIAHSCLPGGNPPDP